MEDFFGGGSPFLKRSRIPPVPLSSTLHRSSLEGKEGCCRYSCKYSRLLFFEWLKALIGVVVYTERRGEVIRIISARKATKREARYYDQIIEN